MSTWQILSLGGLSILLLDVVVHLFFGWRAVRSFESCPPFRKDLSDIDLSAAERVEFPSTEGITLRGGLLLPEQPPRGVILFLPEAQGCWRTVGIHAADLTGAGFAIVAIDFRNQGESDSLDGYAPTHWASEYELHDARAAVEFIRNEPRLANLPLGIHGVSRGGCIGLVLAAREKQISAVFAQGPFSRDALSVHFGRIVVQSLCGGLSRFVPDWHILLTLQVTYFLSERRHRCRYLEISRDLPALADKRLLLTVGARDNYVPASLVQQLAVQAGHHPEDSVWVVPQAKHNEERRVARPEFDRRIRSFFEQSLPPAPPQAKNTPESTLHPPH